MCILVFYEWSQYFVYKSSEVAKELRKDRTYTQITDNIVKSIMQEST